MWHVDNCAHMGQEKLLHVPKCTSPFVWRQTKQDLIPLANTSVPLIRPCVNYSIICPYGSVLDSYQIHLATLSPP